MIAKNPPTAPIGGDARRPLRLQLPSVTACSVPGLRRRGCTMITCQAGLVPGNSGGSPDLRPMRNGDSACAVAAGDDAGGCPTGPVKTANRFAFTRTRMAPSAGQFLPGPVSMADADARVHVPGGAARPVAAGPRRLPAGSQPELAGPGTGDDPGRPAGLASAGRRWRVDDVGCLPQRAGYPLSRPHPLQLFGQLGDQLAQRRHVKHSRLAASVRHPPGPGRLGRAAGLVSQAAGDQAAQPRSPSHRDVPAGAGADRRIRGSTRLRITGSISLRTLRHHNHLTSRTWTAWPA
jgi:hypothetical protein